MYDDEVLDRIVGVLVALLFVALVGGGYSLISAGVRSHDEKIKEIDAQYEGNHLLRQIGERTTTTEHSSATFFLFAGSYTQDSKEFTTVTFSWLDNQGSYRFYTLPLKSVRIKLDTSIGTPYVRFRWTSSAYMVDESNILYAVITCNPKDWPVEIHIPTVVQ